MQSKTVGYLLGLLAAAFWLASAAVSYWALRAKLDLGDGESGDEIGFTAISEEDGSGSITVNGIVVPTFAALAKYQRQVTTRNGIAAALNGTAAICACVAAYLALGDR